MAELVIMAELLTVRLFHISSSSCASINLEDNAFRDSNLRQQPPPLDLIFVYATMSWLAMRQSKSSDVCVCVHVLAHG